MFSTTWAIQYWYLCLIALLIGVATGWWIWARTRPHAAASAPSAAVDPAPAVPAPVAAEPVAAPQPLMDGGPRIAPAVGAPDDLELIKGVGPALSKLLHGLGVHRFDQIAAWGAEEVAEVDAHLGSFKGRIVRDQWVDQAGFLARGDTAGFEARYGGLGSEKG